MTYKIGTRVKKISPPNLGYEGVVVGIGPYSAGRQRNGDHLTFPADVALKYARAWKNIYGDVISADECSYTTYDRIEPIIPDGHRAGEEGTCEPLDKLLSEVRHASVE